jgi:hypothetical protein
MHEALGRGVRDTTFKGGSRNLFFLPSSFEVPPYCPHAFLIEVRLRDGDALGIEV